MSFTIAKMRPRAHVVSRHLTIAADPLTLYKALAIAENGMPRLGTMLFETGDTAIGGHKRSIVVPHVAARLTIRGQKATLQSTSAQGGHVLGAVAAALYPFVVKQTLDSLLFAFPPSHPSTTDLGDEARLLLASPLDVLRRMVDFDVVGDPSCFALFAAGVFSYDALDLFETLPTAQTDPQEYPDAVFGLVESAIVIDRTAGTMRVYSASFEAPFSPQPSRRGPVAPVAERRLQELVRTCERVAGAYAPHATYAPPANVPAAAADVTLSDAEYEALVEKLKLHIYAGDVFQIVPSRTFSAPCPDPLATYARLRTLNPSPYQFFFCDETGTLLGASPETAVRVDSTPEGWMMHLHPIAGTRRRGTTLDEDDRIEAELRLSEKEVAEHMMLVDLARNDVARVAVAGTRRVQPLLSVERYSHVMHLVSGVSGRLRPGLDALHAYAASANMGTLVGAPKLRAAELLRKYEPNKRGPYGGAIGWLSHDGSFDSAIVIRSALVKDGRAFVSAGAGVVFDSDAAAEGAETRQKAAAVLRALGAQP